MAVEKIIVLRGISGSGKSTYAKRLMEERANEGKESWMVSADNYFMRDGEYRFDPSKLKEAHGACLKDYLRVVQHGGKVDLLIVDNTNTQLWEMAPYVAIAEAYKIPYEVIDVVCPVGVALERNVHDVPEHTLRMQEQRFEEPLPWWNSRSVSGCSA